ncbi:RICIN domain-containing protein [Neptunomonas sp.]|uniref:RICIN domain-containing protein n=1 Tax=Neptunomonas sp. TaxID=1971898 RepID=UPI00356A807E
MTKSLIAMLTTLSIFQLVQAQEPEGDFIRLVDALDEPEFYCFDLAGWGDHLKLNDPLQTHTCKDADQATDQMFYFEDKHLKIVGYDRCVQAAGSGASTLAGSAVLARECSDNDLQELKMDAAGKVHVGDGPFCIAAGPDSTDASGPSHVWRTLSVVRCDSTDDSLSTWQIGNN